MMFGFGDRGWFDEGQPVRTSGVVEGAVKGGKPV